MAIDARGKPCPMPVLLAKEALDRGDGAVEVLVDNAVAVENLKRLGSSRQLSVSVEAGEGAWTVRFAAGEGAAPAPRPAQAAPGSACTPAGCGTAVFITRETLGGGDDALGANLMKMFLYTLSQEDAPPAALIFMNGGVRWPTGRDEDAVESIRQLQERGTEVLVCGTCLGFYGLTDAVRVGTVSNMYDILERLQGAAKVITL